MNCKHPRIRGWTTIYDGCPSNRFVCVDCQQEFLPVDYKVDQNLDYSEPLLKMQQLIKRYEQSLINKEWDAVIDLGPSIIVQARILTLISREQANVERSK